MTTKCPHFQTQQCQSCQWINRPYDEQLNEKQIHLKQQIAPLDQSQLRWSAPFQSRQSGFRNKAKMVVSGAVERPVLGILKDQNAPQSAVDLTDCLLYSAGFKPIFPVLKDFIGRAGLVPYNVAKQKGELKYILLTESSYQGDIMLRFVLRSENKIPLIRRELAKLREKLPQLKVISANI
ncbi:23S rRNA (uracil-5-)-methyltransferase RumB [Basfia succiniciproducens]|uniref:23S rRNA (Uracil-5-)-methyltransferase RumB n=1 Tax=Basfia succiniciproducens TaxID=653940 RepID=A0A1G5AQC7_9PAST|nr:23S rRNA (uracil-5-)-methyltransferase RumB [Basfia succiniciproducens]